MLLILAETSSCICWTTSSLLILKRIWSSKLTKVMIHKNFCSEALKIFSLITTVNIEHSFTSCWFIRLAITFLIKSVTNCTYFLNVSTEFCHSIFMHSEFHLKRYASKNCAFLVHKLRLNGEYGKWMSRPLWALHFPTAP